MHARERQRCASRCASSARRVQGRSDVYICTVHKSRAFLHIYLYGESARE